MTSIRNILETRGPRLSSEIASLLVKRDGISREAARKRISRAPHPVQKLLGVKLPNRESFLYLKNQFPGEFYPALIKAFKRTKSSYGRAIVGLEARGGIIHRALFPVASGLTVFKTRGQVLHSFVEDKLINLKILQIYQSTEGELIGFSNQASLPKRRKANLIVESIVLSAMSSWLARVGMSSFHATEIRGKKIPSFGPFNWDLVSPSYLSGLVDIKKDSISLGFIVGDILLGKELTLEDLWPFFSKCEIIRSQRRQKRFIPMFIADYYENLALKEMRHRGFLLARPATIFGEEAAQHLSSLARTIENAAAAVTNDPDGVFNLLKKIGKIEGASLNLRSVVLDFIVSRIFSLDGYYIDIRQEIRSEEGEPAEIDVKAVKSNEAVCVECKAKMPGNLVDADEIQDWLSKKLPRIKSWLKLAGSLPDRKRFEFAVSTDFTEDAKTLVRKVSLQHKRQPITFLNGKKLIDRLSGLKQSSLINIFSEHFVQNPIKS